jgi:hypothetical protein
MILTKIQSKNKDIESKEEEIQLLKKEIYNITTLYNYQKYINNEQRKTLNTVSNALKIKIEELNKITM